MIYIFNLGFLGGNKLEPKSGSVEEWIDFRGQNKITRKQALKIPATEAIMIYNESAPVSRTIKDSKREPKLPFFLLK